MFLDVNGNIPQGIHQTTMPYYEAPPDKAISESKLCLIPLTFFDKKELAFQEANNPIMISIDIRSGDFYLGAAFTNLKESNLFIWFLANANPDNGYPYFNRIPYGSPFQP